MHQKRIIFMGTPIFATAILKMLIEEQYNVIGIISQPDRPVGRKRELKPTPIKELALQHQILVLQPEKLSKDQACIQQIKELAPDLIITCAYGQMVPQEVLDIPSLGCINVHGSLLPKFRGGAPIHMAIITGEKETGITIMEMVKKMDAGDMISKRAIPILETDTLSSVHDKLMDVGASLLKDTLPVILKGEETRTPQNEEEVTYAYNISREQEMISWDLTSREIFNLVRGLNHWPGAYTTLHGEIIKVWAVQIHDCENAMKHHSDQANGTIIKLFNDGIGVKVQDGVIILKRIQLSGKKEMAVEDILRGKHPFIVGEVFNAF